MSKGKEYFFQSNTTKHTFFQTTLFSLRLFRKRLIKTELIIRFPFFACFTATIHKIKFDVPEKYGSKVQQLK